MDFLTFYPDMSLLRFETPLFSLALSSCDDLKLWGPCKNENGSVLVALTGRVALESCEWADAEKVLGHGGLATKAILKKYEQGGIEGVSDLNGNFTVLLFDEKEKKFYIITDRCGSAPVFKSVQFDKFPAFSSHPDLLGLQAGDAAILDYTSLAEFLCTGKVSFPYTYYKEVEAGVNGSIYVLDLHDCTLPKISIKKYFSFDYDPNNSLSEAEHAERLEAAFKKSIERRTYSHLGTTAVALSGGLDSRAILACCTYENDLKAFCFFDEKNVEFEIAKEIATKLNVELIPFKRTFEHYGVSAEAAVRIYGGMGSFVNNHFLSFRDSLLNLGFKNILTGFYCDYLFKGLAQDVTRHPLTRRESATGFKHQWYRPVIWLDSTSGKRARDRIESHFPPGLRSFNNETDRLNIESLRVFPLTYEPDNAESTVPQRVLPWFLPIVDNDIVDAYLQIPSRMKLNASMYSKMVENISGARLAGVVDANTGSRVNTPAIFEIFSLYKKAFRNRLERRTKPKIATSGSWPNWEYYALHSVVLKQLWFRPNAEAQVMLSEILGYDPFNRPLEAWIRNHLELFLRLLTLKIWMDLRCGLASKEVHSELVST